MQKELNDHQRGILHDIEQYMSSTDGCVVIMVCKNGHGFEATVGSVSAEMSLAVGKRAIMQAERIAARVEANRTGRPTTTSEAADVELNHD